MKSDCTHGVEGACTECFEEQNLASLKLELERAQRYAAKVLQQRDHARDQLREIIDVGRALVLALQHAHDYERMPMGEYKRKYSDTPQGKWEPTMIAHIERVLELWKRVNPYG